MPSISFQLILDAALADHRKQVETDLATHSLVNNLGSCGSPHDVLNEFKEFRDGNRKLLNWLSLVPFTCFFSPILSSSVQTSKGDLYWRGCSHRSTYPITLSDCITSLYLDTAGSERHQLAGPPQPPPNTSPDASRDIFLTKTAKSTQSHYLMCHRDMLHDKYIT